MMDNCKHCMLNGNLSKCEEQSCSLRDSWYVESLRAKLAEAEKPLDVDWLSNIIRSIDGNHSLGAGALAEKIVDAIAKQKGDQ